MFRLIGHPSSFPLRSSNCSIGIFRFALFTKVASKKINTSQYATKQSQNSLRTFITSCKDVDKLLSLRKSIFEEHQRLFPLYLEHIVQFIDFSCYSKHKQELQWISDELNKLSPELQMTPLQCLIVLDYRIACRNFNQSYFNYHLGLQRKMNLLISSLIHQRKLSLNQMIFAYDSLRSLGSLNFTLFMNFINYLKQQFKNQPQKIKVEQIITIFDTSMVKRNQITIERILNDHVCNFMMTSKGEEVRSKGINLKVRVLVGLMVTNFRHYYKSSRVMKQSWIKELLSTVNQELSIQNMGILFDGKAEQQKEDVLNWKHIVHITDSVVFALENRIEHECLFKQFGAFLDKTHKCLIHLIKIKDPKKVPSSLKAPLLRIIFNRCLARIWLAQESQRKNIQQFISNMEVLNEKIFYPLEDTIDIFRQTNPENFENLMNTAQMIYESALKQNFIVWGLAARIISYRSVQKSQNVLRHTSQQTINFAILTDLFNRTHKKGAKNSSAILQYYLQRKKPSQFAKQCYQAIKNFRDTTIIGDCILSTITESAFSKYIFDVKRIKKISEEKYNLLELLFITKSNSISNNTDKLTELIDEMVDDEVMRHQVLSKNFIEEFPHPDRYTRQTNFLVHPSTFQRNFRILTYHYKNKIKYNFFIWNTFIRNYSSLPYNIRQECYDLFQQLFMNHYEMENSRKALMLFTISGYIAGRNIVGKPQRLNALFERCIDLIVDENKQDLEFLHNCYVQIVVNALTADLLSIPYFRKIIEYGNKFGQMRVKTTMMLLYGAKLNQQAFHKRIVLSQAQLDMIEEQKDYLRHIPQKFTWQNQAGLSQSEVKNNNTYLLTGKMIACYMWFDLEQIHQLKKAMVSYLSDSNDIVEIMLILRAFDRNEVIDPKKADKMISDVLPLLQDQLRKYEQLGLLTGQQVQQLLLRIK